VIEWPAFDPFSPAGSDVSWIKPLRNGHAEVRITEMGGIGAIGWLPISLLAF
jgi:hypothetical protein